MTLAMFVDLIGSTTLIGMMEFLTSTHRIAKDLRKNLDFIIFPMINPDGVFLGNTR